MKKYYCIALFAIVAAILLQINHIDSLYSNYKLGVKDNIEQALSIALDDELHIRNVLFNGHEPKTTHSIVRIKMEDMTPAMLDSISKLPGAKDTINVTKAREAGTIGTSAEISQQQSQDNHIRRGEYIKLPVLDSIFCYRTDMQLPHRFVLLDKDEKVMDAIGDSRFRHGNFIKTQAIGLKGLQTLRLEADIPMSQFAKQEIQTLISNALLMLLLLGCVVFQLRVIRHKEQMSRKRELASKGIIHDLKSPVGTAITLLGMVKHRYLNDPEAKPLEKNETMMQHLLHEIETLADTVGEHGVRTTISREPVDLAALADKVKQEVDIVYHTKQHNISIDNQLPQDLMPKVDADKVERILRNLVENAVKYADAGVEVQVVLTLQNNALLVSVKDNGWGIEPRYFKKIFRPYYRIEQPEGRYRKGHGMGLTNAQQLVQAHGGKIWVKSEPGKGSAFSFTLR